MTAQDADASADGGPGIVHSWRTAPDRRYLLVSLILSVVGGFADAGSYVLIHSFTGHITGNTILLAVYLIRGDWPDTTSCLIAISAFVAGTASGISLSNTASRSPCRRLARPVAVEIALIGVGLVFSATFIPVGRNLLVACFCLALGLQNGVVGKIETVSFHTTFITGLSTTLISALLSGKPNPKQQMLPLIIGCFVAGAFGGALAVSRLGDLGFTIALMLLVIVWLITVTERSER